MDFAIKYDFSRFEEYIAKQFTIHTQPFWTFAIAHDFLQEIKSICNENRDYPSIKETLL